MTLLLGVFTSAQSQTLGNEWINYSQNYYKFKIGKNGVYRIPYNLLTSNGMASVQGNQFAMYREGVQIPIYVTTTGALGNNDYIEFYASGANGNMDKELFYNEADQGNDQVNIVSDSSVYFLTYTATGGSNLRFSLHNNVLPATLPAAEPFCITTVRPNADNKAAFSLGASLAGAGYNGVYHAGAFDKGEGFTYPQGSTVTLPFTIEAPYTPSNPVLTTSILYYGRNSNRYIRQRVANQLVHDTIISAYAFIKSATPFNESFLAASTTVTIQSQSDRAHVYKANITYNRTFNFANVSTLNFEVPSNGLDQLLSIAGLGASHDNIMVDLTTNNLYHLGAQSNVILDPVSEARQMFFAQDAENVTSLKPVTFRDYTAAANQGSYIILSDDAFINIPGGGVEQYRNYRSSVAGGSYDVVVVSANELYDQFGWGYEYHPLAIRRFLSYADQSSSWVSKPEYMFIIGKGVSYDKLRNYMNMNPAEKFPMVPTFGVPGADNLFAEIGNTSIPRVAIGRLSAFDDLEILNYLQKVQAYEIAIKTPAVPTLENTLWKKRALHVAGTTDDAYQFEFYNALNTAKAIYEDSLIGGTVYTTQRTASFVGQDIGAILDSIIEGGVQYISYYGHASASGFNYNLNNPEHLVSSPRLPIFLAFGCDVARIFEPSRSKTISERYVSYPDGGSVAMVASTTIGWTGFLAYYMEGLYLKFCRDEYGKTLGKQYISNIARMANYIGGPVFNKAHMQNMLLQGDPGLSVFSPEKPDYYVDADLVSAASEIVNTLNDTVSINVKVYNLGKVLEQPVSVVLTKTKEGSSTVLYSDTINVIVRNHKDVKFVVPVDKVNDNGMFTYTITLNPGQTIDEISFDNNTASTNIFYGFNKLVPTYPQEFAIVGSQNLELKATTINPFGDVQTYVLEVDTTEFFNSPIKATLTVNGLGGVISWPMPITMQDSTVYYWRTAVDVPNLTEMDWSYSSFIYLNGIPSGWNQSHYFQYAKDSFDALFITEPERVFTGMHYYKRLMAESGIYGHGSGNNQYLDITRISFGTCMPSANLVDAMLIVVLDPTTGATIENTGQVPGAVFSSCTTGDRKGQYEFRIDDTTGRRQAMEFLNSIPEGYYILVKSNTRSTATSLTTSQMWKDDEAYWGPGVSLYHTLEDLGFPYLDNIGEKIPYAGVVKKGDTTFAPQMVVGASETDILVLDASLPFQLPQGKMYSTVIGPSSEWQQLLWKTTSTDGNDVGDSTLVIVKGLTSLEDSGVVLFTTTNSDTSLQTISASQYPYLQLEWYAQDSTNLTLPQLAYWRILHLSLPEAALIPALAYQGSDTVAAGTPLTFSFAVENVNNIPMDSMKVRFKLLSLTDSSTVTFDPPKFNPLHAGDTIMVGLYDLNTSVMAGEYLLFVEANPDDDQPELFHPNNLGYLKFFVDNGSLPVGLLKFEAEKQHEKALLSWVTVNETNNAGFMIERSANAKVWQRIGFTESKSENGNSSSVLNYSFEDEKPLKGKNYYRLQQLDKDGKVNLSPVRMLVFNSGFDIDVHPNPANTTVVVSGLKGNESVTVTDMTGKQVFSASVSGSELNIDLSHFAEGVYNISVYDTNGQMLLNRKLVKVR